MLCTTTSLFLYVCVWVEQGVLLFLFIVHKSYHQFIMLFGWCNSNVNVNKISSIVFPAGNNCRFKSFAFATASKSQQCVLHGLPIGQNVKTL